MPLMFSHLPRTVLSEMLQFLDDVYQRLYQLSLKSDPIPLDHVFVGISLHQLNITPLNMPKLVLSSAFEIRYDSFQLLCDYVIVHLHGNREDEAARAWRMREEKCKKN